MLGWRGRRLALHETTARAPAAKTDSAGAPKLAYVESLRGMACVLLVSYHVIGDTSLNGLRLAPEHPFSFWNQMFLDVRMPMFSFISGFVLGADASNLTELRGKVSAKVRRLLVPMVVVGLLSYATQRVVAPQPEGPAPFWRLFVLPYQHFWFLQATFLLMLAMFLLTYALRGNGTRAAIVLVVPCAAASLPFEHWQPDVFSCYEALHLAPFFLCGYLIRHAAAARTLVERARTHRGLMVGAVALLGLLFVLEYLLGMGLVSMDGPARRTLGLAVGLSTCLFFFAVRFRSRLLAFIGDKSYAIYLFHVFFTAGSRMLLERLVPGLGVAALFALGLAAGVVGPMVIYWLALRTRLTSLLLLGLRWRPSPAAIPDLARANPDAAQVGSSTPRGRDPSARSRSG